MCKKENVGYFVSRDLHDKIEAERIKWQNRNNKMLSSEEFFEVLLENYTQDFTGQAQRLAASNGEN